MKNLVKQLPIIIGLMLIWWFNNTILLLFQQHHESQVGHLLIMACNGLMLVGAWLASKQIVLYSRERFSHQNQALKHKFFLAVWLFSLPLIYVILLKIGDWAGVWRGLFKIFKGHVNDRNLPVGVFLYIINFAFFLVLIFIDEWTYNQRRQRRYELEIEKLKQENLQTQLHLLKSQINPHFLFNSLNTLSELVMDNPQAEAFVDKLASVYRYLLQSNHELLCPLENEIRFIKAYFHLLETRHGSSVKLEISVEKEWMKWQLPPLTLQLLVENAVKHNVVSEASPLLIRLFNDGENLVVENNVQRKSITVPSNKVGLSNIAKKYQLLGGKQVVVISDERSFRVALPLIKPDLGM